jgi:GntR family transcriptional regulator of vanillate catabolism
MPKSAATLRHAAAPAEDGGSHAVKVQLRLREMILAGELAAGSRITELGMVERLGVSRTPIRAALIRLEQEGLLQMLPSGGYVVRTFSESDVADAIELRGTLEGLAARRAAERGVDESALAQARQLLCAIDELLARSELDDAAFGTYVQLNRRFHDLLAGLCHSPVLRREIDRVCGMPFASPSGFVIQQANSPRARDMLVVAQNQHWQVMDAIAAREGARAEAILREHSRLAQRNLRDALQAHTDLPGAGLIQPRPTVTH